MIRAVAGVLAGEGVGSAFTRGQERLAEAWRDLQLRLRRQDGECFKAPILNYVASGIASRLGGLQVQLQLRLHHERRQRRVVLLRGTLLEGRGVARRVDGLPQALALSGARLLHVEGSHGVDIDALLRLAERGIGLLLSLHDFELCGQPRAQALLDACRQVVFPSAFLREAYRERFRLGPSRVIEPGIARSCVRAQGRQIGFAGGVKPHKGAQLLPRLAAGQPLHVFGGGDRDLFAELRRHRNLQLHGYYRVGTLPALLLRERIGLLVLPSIVPETFCLVMSEAWQAGIAVASLDLGAQAARIREHGGGWVAADLDALAGVLQQWREGALSAPTPPVVPLDTDCAAAYLALYAELLATD